MAMVRIASVSESNVETFKSVAKQHSLPYNLVPYEDKPGYHLYIEFNHVTFFREIVAPTYRASVELFSSQAFGRAFRRANSA